MEVRRLRADEWRTALALRVAALTESPEAFGSTVAREQGLSQETWRDRLSANTWLVASSADADTAVGLVCGVHTAVVEERELTALWVAPGHRGRGLGDALVGAVIDWAAADGAERVTLQVVGSNEGALRLYRRHGFEVVGASQAPGHDVREGDLVMQLDLSGVTRPGPHHTHP